MAVRKPKNIWKIPHIIYENTHDHNLLQSWRIVVIHIIDGGLRRTLIYNRLTAVAEYSIGVHGLNLGRRMALFCLRILLGVERDQTRKTVHTQCDTVWKR